MIEKAKEKMIKVKQNKITMIDNMLAMELDIV